MSGNNPKAAAIAWFREETYEADRALMADQRYLPATRTAWRTAIVRQMAALARLGIDPPIRVDLDAHAFVEWCTQRKFKPNAAARGYFVAELLEGMKRG